MVPKYAFQCISIIFKPKTLRPLVDQIYMMDCTVQSSQELFNKRVTLSFASDIWAAGCMLFGMFADPMSHLIHNIETYQMTCSQTFEELTAPGLEAFVEKRVHRFLFATADIGKIAQKCLSALPQKRLSAAELRLALIPHEDHGSNRPDGK